MDMSTSMDMNRRVADGIPFAAYLDWPAVSQSSLNPWYEAAPIGAYAAANPDRDQTSAMRFGTMVHMHLFEPNRYAADVVWIEGGANMPVAATWRKWEQEHAGMIPAPACWRDRVAAVAASLERDPVAAPLLRAKGIRREVSCCWLEGDTACKARMDLVVPGFGIADLKVSDSVLPADFARQAVNLGWDVQNAWYQRAAFMSGLCPEIPGFAHIVVSPEPPHLVRVYELDRDAVESGWKKALIALGRYQAWRAGNARQGEPDGIVMVSLPPWGMAPQAQQVRCRIDEIA